MKNTNLNTNQQGMTLIEIMIAMLLGSVLLTGVIQIFTSSNKTYRLQENMSRLQENGRFAMSFLTQDIRQLGYFGCLGRNFNSANIENALKDQTNVAWDMTTALTGYDNVDSSFPVFSNVIINSDVIVVRGLSANEIPLISPFSDSAQMFVDPTFNDDCPSSKATTCHIGDILIVTDCSQGTIFQSTNTQSTGGGTGVNVVSSGNATFIPGNNSPILSNSYGQGSKIAKLKTSGYFIRLNPAMNPALYRASLSVTGNKVNILSAEELVEGIENMQILYGEDTDDDGTANYYVPSSPAVDMSAVISIRVSLLVTSLDDNLTQKPVPYTYNGTTTTPTDRRLRRVFSSTVAVRNRLK